ncbi:orotidine-5'-phosphate decarboxylase [Leptospira sp. GIMC2001]|uniref:orotidine-5'-phosphate decarboxylase n=1 Tax=Leptospira sp. GIMC2001 TaxID=1513297 RepID=UPI00234A430C|nr:orotidine-5'-phosphate decarboxylase [Leptospira sp. GIMC2001]WCL47766.1 orotidine-5'-phosphate decarboxylase [Leptospira sp. GIMC2001]
MLSLENKYTNRFSALQSLLTVGLDPEWEKLPDIIKKEKDPFFQFCKQIIDATGEFALGFKPNIAFFERFGWEGIRQFELVIEYIRKNFPDSIIIADAKRGDLGNTAKEYAMYYFDRLNVDVLTVSPYMGRDTITPYLEHDRGSVFILCLTSNPSAIEFQKWKDKEHDIVPGYLHQAVAKLSTELNREYKGRVGIVTGGTRPSEIGLIREENPELLFLIPGFGAQGGDLEEIIQNSGKRAFINSSRGIHFLSSGLDFAEKAHDRAKEIHNSMKKILSMSV